MLKELTQKYIKAFANKDSEAIASMLNEEFVLEDPVIKRVEGKEKALEAIKKIFASCSNLEFKAKNIFVIDPNTTIIEFILQLDRVYLQGVDIIVFKDNQLNSDVE